MLTGAWDMRAGTRNMLTGARDMRAGAGQIIKDGNVLLAMKRQDFERRAQDAPNLDWLTSKTVGVLSVGLPRPSFAAPETMQEVPVATYHVMIQDGKLSVEVENDPGGATGGLAADLGGGAGGVRGHRVAGHLVRPPPLRHASGEGTVVTPRRAAIIFHPDRFSLACPSHAA